MAIVLKLTSCIKTNTQLTLLQKSYKHLIYEPRISLTCLFSHPRRRLPLEQRKQNVTDKYVPL